MKMQLLKLPKNFKKLLLQLKTTKLTIIEEFKKQNLYVFDFIPEVTHTNNGIQIFKNFYFQFA